MSLSPAFRPQPALTLFWATDDAGIVEIRTVQSPSQNVRDEIGNLLRQHYDEVLHEPLPQSLLALLERLDMDGAPFSEPADRSVLDDPFLSAGGWACNAHKWR